MTKKTLAIHRMKILMEKLGNPQDKLNIIHVAGTNGKGSVCSMLSTILIESGYKVGLFTSPHLIDYNERIQVQNTPITDAEFKKLKLKVKKKVLEMKDEGYEAPRFFEHIAAMAIICFYKAKTDIVILETGIGGTYDATNIIKNPLVSVITSIGKDHTSMLGNTIKEITIEKGGIIKENCPLVLYEADKTVYNNISRLCKSKNSKLISTPKTKITNKTHSLGGITFDVKNKVLDYKGLEIKLIGDYQIKNTVTTLMLVEELRNMEYNITRSNIYKGLARTKWEGRMEVIRRNPTIILDGAHNIESAKAFVKSVESINKDSKVNILIGVFEDKQYNEIIDIILPYSKSIIVTESSHLRALPAEKLYKTIKDKNPKINITLEKDLEKAYNLSKDLKEDDFMYCVGSLYLVGEIKRILKNQEGNNDRL